MLAQKHADLFSIVYIKHQLKKVVFFNNCVGFLKIFYGLLNLRKLIKKNG